MRFNIKIFALALGVSIIIAAGVFVASAQNEFDFFRAGQEQSASLHKNDDTETLALINNEVITLDNFNFYKNKLSYSATKYTDKEILEILIKKNVILQEAVKQGFRVSDKEVQDMYDQNFAVIAKNAEVKKNIEDYIAGLGITAEEYESMVKEEYREILLTDKLMQSVKEKKRQEPKDSTDSIAPDITQEENVELDAYWDSYVDELCDLYDIKILDASLQ